MDTIDCLVRTEEVNNRKFVLIVFPSQQTDQKIGCWSPIDGHTVCDLGYLKEHTTEAPDGLAETMMARYQKQYQANVEPFKLNRIKKLPKT